MGGGGDSEGAAEEGESRSEDALSLGVPRSGTKVAKNAT